MDFLVKITAYTFPENVKKGSVKFDVKPGSFYTWLGNTVTVLILLI